MTWLATIGTKLKVWALIFAGFAVTVASFLLMKEQRDKARDAAERYKAKAHHANTVAKKRNKNELEFRSRRAEAKKEIESGAGSSVFRDPNSMFGDDTTD